MDYPPLNPMAFHSSFLSPSFFIQLTHRFQQIIRLLFFTLSFHIHVDTANLAHLTGQLWRYIPDHIPTLRCKSRQGWVKLPQTDILLMAEIRRSPVEGQVVYPIFYRVSAPSQMVIARFQPSTVAPENRPNSPKRKGGSSSNHPGSRVPFDQRTQPGNGKSHIVWYRNSIYKLWIFRWYVTSSRVYLVNGGDLSNSELRLACETDFYAMPTWMLNSCLLKHFFLERPNIPTIYRERLSHRNLGTLTESIRVTLVLHVFPCWSLHQKTHDIWETSDPALRKQHKHSKKSKSMILVLIVAFKTT